MTFRQKLAVSIECAFCKKTFTKRWFNNIFCSKSCTQKHDYFKNKAGTEKEKKRNRQRRHRHKHGINSRFQVYKRNAIKAGYEFQLTKELLDKFTNKPCFYCGVFTPVNGVDRVDSRKGYVEGNMVSCCKYCNRAKSDLSQKDFFVMCARVCQKHSLVPITFKA